MARSGTLFENIMCVCYYEMSTHFIKNLFISIYSNVEKRNDFLKHMRIIIRESVKKMAVPKQKPVDTEVRLRHSVIDHTRHSVVEPRLRHSVTTDLRAHSNMAATSLNLHDNRYSMNLDCEKLTIPELDQRSRTFGDLVDLHDGGGLSLRHTSKNSVNSDTSHGSGAVLVHTSQDPMTYSSKGSLDYVEPSSPVWEKRSGSPSNLDSLSHTRTQSGESRRSMKIHEYYINGATEC